MRIQPKVSYKEPSYQYIIDLAKNVPVIAIMGVGGKTTVAVLVALNLKQLGYRVKLCNLDTLERVPNELNDIESPDYVVVNCPAYTTEQEAETVAACSAISRAAKVNLVAIGSQEHHLPYSFNLLMGMINSLNNVSLYHYLFVDYFDDSSTESNHGLVAQGRVAVELDVLTQFNPRQIVSFEQIGALTFSKAITQWADNDFESQALAVDGFEPAIAQLKALMNTC